MCKKHPKYVTVWVQKHFITENKIMHFTWNFRNYISCCVSGIKQTQRKTAHSPRPTTEIKILRIFIFTSPHTFIAQCLRADTLRRLVLHESGILCKSYLRHDRSGQTDNWTTLAACHRLQNGQVSAVLPIMQLKYSNTVLNFLISFTSKCY
jgi:hypothetical protein